MKASGRPGQSPRTPGEDEVAGGEVLAQQVGLDLAPPQVFWGT